MPKNIAPLMRASNWSSAGQQNIFFRGQHSYPHGTHMCTTACMNMAVAVLCKLVEVGRGHDEVQKSLEGIMQLASQAQAGFEVQHSSGLPRMLSVHEIIHECRLDLPRLGITRQELFVVERHSSHTKDQECFVDVRELPARLRTKGSTCCAATATGNGHTVCVICYDEHTKFALFDSLPGLLATNLDEASLLQRMGAALGFQLQQPCATTTIADQLRKGKRIAAEEDASLQKKRKKVSFASEGGNQRHLCDVTIFWKQCPAT